MSPLDQEDRDEAFKKCFRAGMTQAQIIRLSQSWKFPINWQQQVSEIQHRLRLVRSSVIQPHVSRTNDMLIDVILECHRAGWTVEFWEKEHDLGGFRADFFVDVRKGKRVHYYYGEMQISDLNLDQWIGKLAPYFEKFREQIYVQHVLIRCKGEYNQRRAITAVNELFGDWKTLRFVLISTGDKWVNRAGQVRELVQ